MSLFIPGYIFAIFIYFFLYLLPPLVASFQCIVSACHLIYYATRIVLYRARLLVICCATIRNRADINGLELNSFQSLNSRSRVSSFIRFFFVQLLILDDFLLLQCSATCGVGTAERIVACRMENGSLVESVFCAGQERPVSVQQCVELPCPTTEAPIMTTTSTTAATTTTAIPLPTTQTPITGIAPTATTAVPSLALAGFRPQPFEIHIDPGLNNIVPTSNWNPESNDIPRILGTWRIGDWGQVHFHYFFFLNVYSVI